MPLADKAKSDPILRVAHILAVRPVERIAKPRQQEPDLFKQEPPPVQMQADNRRPARKKVLKEIADAMAYNVEFLFARGATTGDRKWNGKGLELVEENQKSILDAEAIDLLLALGLIEPTTGFNKYAWTPLGARKRDAYRGVRI